VNIDSGVIDTLETCKVEDGTLDYDAVAEVAR